MTILWSHERNAACYLLAQVIPVSSLISPADVDMCDRLRTLAATQKLQRVAAYREWQGLSHALLQVTGSTSLDSFRIPDAIRWQRVPDGEQRVVDESNPDVNLVYFVDLRTRARVLAVATAQDLANLFQATVIIDSGSVGRVAGFFSMHKLGLNIFVLFDKIHRLIRDVKLAAEKSAGGVLYRALLHICFVFSLNQRPFCNGEWFSKKKEILAFFMDTNTSESPIFLAYADFIARDMGRVCDSDEDREALFQSLAELPSFDKKGGLPPK